MCSNGQRIWGKAQKIGAEIPGSVNDSQHLPLEVMEQDFVNLCADWLHQAFRWSNQNVMNRVVSSRFLLGHRDYKFLLFSFLVKACCGKSKMFALPKINGKNVEVGHPKKKFHLPTFVLVLGSVSACLFDFLCCDPEKIYWCIDPNAPLGSRPGHPNLTLLLRSWRRKFGAAAAKKRDDQRKFRSQTSDNTEILKAEKRRVQGKRRREKESEERRYRCAKC